MGILQQETSKKITKSQKRHLKKVEKRKLRKEQRKAKQLKEQQESGKLIEENHNGGLYSPEFTKKASTWYLQELVKLCVESISPESFLRGFRGLRPKLQTVLLKWSDELVRSSEFWFFKELLDRYRSNKEDASGLFEYCTKILKENGFIKWI